MYALHLGLARLKATFYMGDDCIFSLALMTEELKPKIFRRQRFRVGWVNLIIFLLNFRLKAYVQRQHGLLDIAECYYNFAVEGVYTKKLYHILFDRI